MLRGVFASVLNLQVLQPVVIPDTILVMNHLILPERSANVTFHDESMLHETHSDTVSCKSSNKVAIVVVLPMYLVLIGSLR